MRPMTPLEQDKGNFGLERIKALSPEEYQRVRAEFERAVDNSVRQVLRSVLSSFTSIEDMARSGDVKTSALAVMCGQAAKKTHGDVWVVRDQVLAAFSILESGGYIPPFGRTEQEIEDAKGNPRASAHGGR